MIPLKCDVLFSPDSYNSKHKRIGKQFMEQSGMHYQIVIAGHLDKQWEEWFAPLKLTQLSNGTTHLCGWLADQGVLFGILNKLYRLNLTLLSLNKIENG